MANKTANLHIREAGTSELLLKNGLNDESLVKIAASSSQNITSSQFVGGEIL